MKNFVLYFGKCWENYNEFNYTRWTIFSYYTHWINNGFCIFLNTNSSIYLNVNYQRVYGVSRVFLWPFTTFLWKLICSSGIQQRNNFRFSFIFPYHIEVTLLEIMVIISIQIVSYAYVKSLMVLLTFFTYHFCSIMAM